MAAGREPGSPWSLVWPQLPNSRGWGRRSGPPTLSPGLTGSGSWEGSRRQGVPNPRVLASPRSAAQGAGEEAGRRGDHRADGGWEAPGGAREEGAPVRLHVLWPAASLHHRHHERPGLLHLLRHPLQPGRGHRGHGQQQHHPPRGQGHQGGTRRLARGVADPLRLFEPRSPGRMRRAWLPLQGPL